MSGTNFKSGLSAMGVPLFGGDGMLPKLGGDGQVFFVDPANGDYHISSGSQAVR